MICVLELKTFSVEHWYGSIGLFASRQDACSKVVYLTYKVNTIQARLLNSSQLAYWQPGDECNAFFSRQAVISHAKKMWRGISPEAQSLVLGTRLLVGFDQITHLESRYEARIPRH